MLDRLRRAVNKQMNAPDEAPEEKTVDNVTIRAVAKELRRRHATIAFELLSREEAKQLVEDVHGSIRTP